MLHERHIHHYSILFCIIIDIKEWKKLSLVSLVLMLLRTLYLGPPPLFPAPLPHKWTPRVRCPERHTAPLPKIDFSVSDDSEHLFFPVKKKYGSDARNATQAYSPPLLNFGVPPEINLKSWLPDSVIINVSFWCNVRICIKYDFSIQRCFFRVRMVFWKWLKVRQGWGWQKNSDLTSTNIWEWQTTVAHCFLIAHPLPLPSTIYLFPDVPYTSTLYLCLYLNPSQQPFIQ